MNAHFLRAALVLLAAAGAPRLLDAQSLPPQGGTPVKARPLSLSEALERAERVSESVGIAQAEVTRAEGNRRRTRSAYFPQLTGSATYIRTLQSQFSGLAGGDSALSEFQDLPFGRVNSYRFALSLSQTLFSGGQIQGQTHAASAGLRSAAIGLTSARAQLLLDVTSAYYDASLAERLSDIAQATLRQADTTLSQTRLARQVGNQSEFDLLRARVTRDNQRPVVIQRQADRELAHYRLKQLLDLPLDQPLVLSTELGDTAVVGPARLASVVEQLGDTSTAGRAPVRQANEAVEAQRGLLRAAKGQRLPQVSLTTQYAQLGYPDNLSPFNTTFVDDWTILLGLQFPIFTGGRIGGDVSVARANLNQAELRSKQTQELAEVDARNAMLQLDAAEAGWQASAGTVEQAGHAYQIAEIRYREGISTQTELLDSRIQLEQAQAGRARAARDLQVARMRLALLPALPITVGGTTAASAAQTVPAPSATPTPIYRPPAPPITAVELTGLGQ